MFSNYSSGKTNWTVVMWDTSLYVFSYGFLRVLLETLYVTVSTKYKPRMKYPLMSDITQVACRVLTEKRVGD